MAQKKACDLQEGERMSFKDQVMLGIRCCTGLFDKRYSECPYNLDKRCSECPYDKDENGKQRAQSECKQMLMDDFDLLISDMENTIKLLEGNL